MIANNFIKIFNEWPPQSSERQHMEKKKHQNFFHNKKKNTNNQKSLTIAFGDAVLEDEQARIGSKEIMYKVENENGKAEVTYSSNKRLKQVLRSVQREEEYDKRFPKLKLIGKENKNRRPLLRFFRTNLNGNRFWSSKRDRIIYSNRVDQLMRSEKKICRKCGFEGHEGKECNMQRCKQCSQFHENKICTYVFPQIDY